MCQVTEVPSDRGNDFKGVFKDHKKTTCFMLFPLTWAMQKTCPQLVHWDALSIHNTLKKGCPFWI